MDEGLSLFQYIHKYGLRSLWTLWRNDDMTTADTTEIVYTCAPKPYDVLDGIMAYESGEMDEDEVIEFFQHLLTTGMCWHLQGHYGRTATALLEAGLISE